MALLSLAMAQAPIYAAAYRLTLISSTRARPLGWRSSTERSVRAGLRWVKSIQASAWSSTCLNARPVSLRGSLLPWATDGAPGLIQPPLGGPSRLTGCPITEALATASVVTRAPRQSEPSDLDPLRSAVPNVSDQRCALVNQKGPHSLTGHRIVTARTRFGCRPRSGAQRRTLCAATRARCRSPEQTPRLAVMPVAFIPVEWVRYGHPPDFAGTGNDRLLERIVAG
jgi:hypothetical protein